MLIIFVRIFNGLVFKVVLTYTYTAYKGKKDVFNVGSFKTEGLFRVCMYTLMTKITILSGRV